MALRELSREQVLDCIDHPERAASITGNFLCFQMITIKERLGEWRFAGTAKNLAEALQRLGHVLQRVTPDAQGTPLELIRAVASTRSVCFDPREREAWSKDTIDDLGPHVVVVFGEGQAPYDHAGMLVVAVPKFGAWASHPIDDYPPDADGWDDDDD